MRNNVYILLLVLAFLSACEQLTYQPENLEDEFTNPYDPYSDNYILPKASILDGPGNETFITDTNRVAFSWEGTYDSSRFIIGLNAHFLDTINETSYDFNYLPNETFTFFVREIDHWGNVQNDSTRQSFHIDYMPATNYLLDFSTSMIYAYSDSIFTVDVVVNDISNALGASIALTYDPLALSFLSFEKGSFLGSNTNNVVLNPINDTENGKLVFDCTMLQSANGVSGSGSIIRLEFKANEIIECMLQFDAEQSYLRDFENNEIEVDVYGKVKINILEL